MKTRSLSIPVDEKHGEVSAEYVLADKPIALVSLAHGAGAGMQHSFMVSLANALAANGISSLRFNFPFTQQKKRRPDTPVVAQATIKAVLAQAMVDFPKLPLFVSGKSFGGRMSSQLMAADPHTAVRGIIFYGFPLHPSGKPATDRAEHLKAVKVPMLFLQGTRDELAKLDLIEPVCKALPKTKLIKMEGADHSFKAGKLDLIPLLAEETLQWIKGVIKS